MCVAMLKRETTPSYDGELNSIMLPASQPIMSTRLNARSN